MRAQPTKRRLEVRGVSEDAKRSSEHGRCFCTAQEHKLLLKSTPPMDDGMWKRGGVLGLLSSETGVLAWCMDRILQREKK